MEELDGHNSEDFCGAPPLHATHLHRHQGQMTLPPSSATYLSCTIQATAILDCFQSAMPSHPFFPHNLCTWTARDTLEGCQGGEGRGGETGKVSSVESSLLLHRASMQPLRTGPTTVPSPLGISQLSMGSLTARPTGTMPLD